MLPKGTILANRYELGEPLGQGGMATVYRAIDTRLDVERAIKVINAQFARKRSLMARFEREGRLMAKLEHPNIAPVHDVVLESPHGAWIVMSLMVGGSLHDHIHTHGAMPEAQAVEVLKGVLRALAVAHEHGVVHRDVKPHNVLFDAHGQPRLTDFGIASESSDHSLTRTGAVMGTWAYMAPEQRSSAKGTDGRTDLYACGSMLFEMIRAEEPHELHADDARNEQLEGVSQDMADFITSCTRYRPEDRFNDAHEALDALGRLNLAPVPPLAPKLGATWTAPGEEPTNGVTQTKATLAGWMDEEKDDVGPTAVPPLGEMDTPTSSSPPITVFEPSQPLPADTVAPSPTDTVPPSSVELRSHSGLRGSVVFVGALVVATLCSGAIGTGWWWSDAGSPPDGPVAPVPAVVEPAAPVVEPVPSPIPTPAPVDVRAPKPPSTSVPPTQVAKPVPDPEPVAKPAIPVEPAVPVEPPIPVEPLIPVQPAAPVVVAPVEKPVGSIRVGSKPNGATVWVDGVRHSQQTPTIIRSLTPGSRRIKLESPSGVIQRPVTVEEGKRGRFCWDFTKDGRC